MRGYKNIGYIRNCVTDELWVMYMRGNTAYMYTSNKEDYKPIKKVRTFKSKSEILEYLNSNKQLRAFITIFR